MTDQTSYYLRRCGNSLTCTKSPKFATSFYLSIDSSHERYFYITLSPNKEYLNEHNNSLEVSSKGETLYTLREAATKKEHLNIKPPWSQYRFIKLANTTKYIGINGEKGPVIGSKDNRAYFKLESKAEASSLEVESAGVGASPQLRNLQGET